MLILCQKPPLSLWHPKRCLESECLECGVTTLKVYLGELQFDRLIKWKSIRYEVVWKTIEGREKKA
jgi:hypothetical protein